jgi:hypothetical protein
MFVLGNVLIWLFTNEPYQMTGREFTPSPFVFRMDASAIREKKITRADPCQRVNGYLPCWCMPPVLGGDYGCNTVETTVNSLLYFQGR